MPYLAISWVKPILSSASHQWVINKFLLDLFELLDSRGPRFVLAHDICAHEGYLSILHWGDHWAVPKLIGDDRGLYRVVSILISLQVDRHVYAFLVYLLYVDIPRLSVPLPLHFLPKGVMGTRLAEMLRWYYTGGASQSILSLLQLWEPLQEMGDPIEIKKIEKTYWASWWIFL